MKHKAKKINGINKLIKFEEKDQRKLKKFTKHIALNTIYMYNMSVLTDYEINPSKLNVFKH